MVEVNRMDNVLNILSLQKVLGKNRPMRACREKHGDFFSRYMDGDEDILPSFVIQYRKVDGFINMTIADDALLRDIVAIGDMKIALGLDNEKNIMFKSRLYFGLDKTQGEITSPASHRFAVDIIDVYRLYLGGFRLEKRWKDLMVSFNNCFMEGSLWQDAIKVMANFTEKVD